MITTKNIVKNKWLMVLSFIIYHLSISPAGAQIPLVFGVENTGFHLDKPVMPAPDQLPVIRELPDALEGVSTFAD